MKTTLFCMLLLSGMSVKAQKTSHYLFAYFSSNSTEGQQVSYAISDNGLDFTPINGGRPVIASDTIALSGAIRDPHLLRGHDGWFRMVLTDMDWQRGKWSNRGIVMMRSRDLVHWEHHTVHFPQRYTGLDAAQTNAVWAPQTIYDASQDKYMVYFSLHSEADGPYPKDAVFYAYANKDFSDLEDSPKPLFHYPDPTIDTDIVQDERGIFHLFFNTWGAEGIQRRQFTFRNLHEPDSWTLIPGRMQPNNIDSEGSTAYPLAQGGWVLCYDCFRDGIFQFCTSEDLMTFTLVRSTHAKQGVDLEAHATPSFTPRHGSVIQITDAERQTLLDTWPGSM